MSETSDTELMVLEDAISSPQLGQCRLKQGRYAEAEAPLRESLAIRQK